MAWASPHPLRDNGAGRTMPEPDPQASHLYRCAMGAELYHDDLRWCYMCMDWVVDGTVCRGEFDVAQSSGYRGS